MAVREEILRIKIVGTKEQAKQLGSLDLSLKKITAENKKLTKSTDILEKKNKTGGKVFKALTQAIGQNQLRIKSLRAAKIKLNSKVEDEIKLINTTKGSYNALAAQIRIDSQALKRLEDPLGKNKKSFDRLSKSIRTNTDRLKQMDAAMGRQQRNVGNYSGALQGARTALVKTAAAVAGAIIVIRTLSRVFGAIGKTVSNFQQANADLAAVLGKSRSEITQLTEDAKRLGSTTAFSATQVSTLQKEFAKLGFSTQEILGATEATLNLAAATGTDLAKAAAVAGSTVRAFGLDAKDTQRVTDVMAKSFSSSALDMEKFSTAMAVVAPVAKAAGVEIEEATSLLGVLADRGLDASTSGTSLRNIFLELAKEGITMEEAFEKINNSTNKLNEANLLFGKRGATAALILAENADQAKRLELELGKAGGTAERMAEEQLDTLQGSSIKLTSAWEGFVLSLEDGDGAIAKLVRGVLDLTTNLLNLLTSTNDVTDAESAQIQELQKLQNEFNSEVNTLKFANLEQDERRKLIEQINIRYGEYLPNLVTEQTSLEKLEELQANFNNQIIKRILLAKQQEALEELAEQRVAGAEKRQALLVEQGELINTINELQKTSGTIFEDGAIAVGKSKLANEDYNDELETTQNRLDEVNRELAVNSDFFLANAGIAQRVSQEAEELAAILGSILNPAIKKNTDLIEENTDAVTDNADKLTALQKQLADARIRNIEDEFKRREAAENQRFTREKSRIQTEFTETVELRSTGLLLIEELETEHQGRLRQIKKESDDKINADEDADRELKQQKQEQAANFFASETLKLGNQIVRLTGTRTNSEIKIIEKRNNKELQKLQSKFDKGLISQSQFDRKSNALRNESDDKIKKLEEKQFKREKALAVAQVLISTSAAIVRGIQQFGPPPSPVGIAAILLATIIGALQLATIKAQTFKKGGVLKGKSHAQGGIPTVDGQMEFEGGEAVINKNSTAMFQDVLSGINQAGGGKPFEHGGIVRKFQAGALTPIIPTPSRLTRELREVNFDPLITGLRGVISEEVGSLRVKNVVTETTAEQTAVKNIESEAFFG